MSKENIYDKKYAKEMTNYKENRGDLVFIWTFSFVNQILILVIIVCQWVVHLVIVPIVGCLNKKNQDMEIIVGGLEPIAFVILRQNFFLVANIFIGSFFKFFVFLNYNFSVIIFPFMGGFFHMRPRVRVVIVKICM